MNKRLQVYDLNLKKTAILENAFDITEKRPLNKVYSLAFKLPDEDAKNTYCEALRYVRYGDDGDFYRIIADGRSQSDAGVRTYACEHAIGTLIDDLMFGTETVSNVSSAESINFVLSRQRTRRWILGGCDFDARYEYLWTNENLLNALFSIPKPWTTPYRWTYDFSAFPWRIALRAIDVNKAPDYYIRAKRNLLSSEERKSHLDICTRLYALGYGEGVNQLTIAAVNNGKPYVDAPETAIARYGLVARTFVDRSIEDANLLLARARATLAGLQGPALERRFDVIDLYPITNDPIDQAEPGEVARLVEDATTTYITETTRVLDEPGKLTIQLSTRQTDVANAIAELADRQRIEATYAQGSTQLYAQSISENATADKGAKLSFYLPGEMRYINKVTARIELKRFRAFNRQTKGGGKSVRTSSSGGGTTQTSSASGSGSFNSENNVEIYTTSRPSQTFTHSVLIDTDETGDSGALSMSGQATLGSSSRTTNKKTTYPGQQHDHQVDIQHYHYLDVSGANHKHSVLDALSKHEHNMYHTHEVGIPPHKHVTFVSAHTHSVQTPSHTHQVDIPEHRHEIEQGIFEYGSPQSAEIWIEGAKRLDIGKSGEFDLTPYILSANGKIPRGQWIDIEVKPNDLAYVRINLFVQGFIQSRGGGNY